MSALDRSENVMDHDSTAIASVRSLRGRVLLVSPVPTHPPTAGNRIRILRMTQAIESLGYAVDFAHVLREQGDPELMKAHWGERYLPIDYSNPARQQQSLGVKLVKKVRNLFGLGCAIDAWYDPGMDAQLRAISSLNDYDTVIVEYVFMSRALEVFGPSVHKVIDTHDVFARRNLRFQQQGQLTGWFSTSQRQEAIGLSRADEVIAIQSREAAYFSQIQSRPVVTIGDLLDLQELQPDADNGQLGNEGGTRLLLVSSNNPSNLQAARWFLDAVFPKVQEKYPGVRITVVGGLAAALNDQPGLERVGPVMFLDAVYAQATAVINPVRVGTGLKIKTLEALAHGKPLVTTSVGGEGLEDGWADAFLVADFPDDFADAVCNLLTNQDDARALARRARDFAERCNRQSYQALESLLGSHSSNAQ